MTRKTVFGILGGVVIAITAILALVFYATSGMTGAADAFFKQARNADIDEIYPLTSTQLKNTVSPAQLAAFMRANRFEQVAETTWGSRSIENRVGSVEGTLRLDDGGSFRSR